MKLAPSLELYSYWDALRGARSAPERNDIEPAAIRGVLADTFILELTRKSGFPLRLSGSRTNALFGRELRGEPFLGLWRKEDAQEVSRVIESAADGAQPYLIGARGGPAGAPALDLEVLLLPLRHHGATHARALGCFAPATGADWFGLLPMRPLELATLRALSKTPAAGFTSRPPSPPGFQRRGHLFVYSART